MPAAEIRSATLGDYEAFASLFPELGVADPVPDREGYARALQSRMFVATQRERVVAYALYERLDGVGYVRNIVVAPDQRGRGLGRALMEHLRLFFSRHGASAWCLNVDPKNTAAVALYRRCGLELAYEAHALRIAMNADLAGCGMTQTHSSELHAACSVPAPEVDIHTIDPEHEAELEHRFGLIAGQLSSARTQVGRDLLVFRVAGQPVGLAVFDPRFPGAFPFRLDHPRLLPPIIRYFRRRAPPRAQWVQLVAEDDPTLTETLLAMGATVAVHYVHMRGSLADS
jgi:ribosomal protein S18 acetylase RimI-like enzyme